MPTNAQVWMHGEELESCPCDFNVETGEVESNGGQQWLFRFEGRTYRLLTDWTETVLYRPDAPAQRARSRGIKAKPAKHTTHSPPTPTP